ncbi:MAG: 6-bladed beta-propeller, partial [Candidatus Saccharimonas sp.]|nr:6-bladed beta-propeller [Planctomycetaceae bacterium]
MKSCWLSIAVVFGLVLPVFAADKVRPVRMGCGIMTFDTVPGWGLGEDGRSVLGSTHGG